MTERDQEEIAQKGAGIKTARIIKRSKLRARLARLEFRAQNKHSNFRAQNLRDPI
jgi:hypothetical protein